MNLRVLLLVAIAPLAAVAEPPKVPVSVPAVYQRLFLRYVDDKTLTADDQLRVGILRDELNRTFALVAGVDNYSQVAPASDRALPPAGADLDKLIHYLTTNGFCDEVVVLRNGDFTFDNLNYFLSTYFPDRLRTNPNSRFLFAFSGHGMTQSGKGYLLLPTATSLADKAHSIDLNVIRPLFDDVLTEARQVLVLINSCYGGAFLRRSFAAGRYAPKQPGAHAITAGGSREKTWALDSGGSVFFNKFLAGVDGKADIYPVDVQTGARGDGVVTVDELFSYLRQEVNIATDEAQNPQIGDLSKDGSTGSFFFLTPKFRNPPVSPTAVLPPGAKTSFGAQPTAADFSVSLVRAKENGLIDQEREISSSEYTIRLGNIAADYSASLMFFLSNRSMESQDLQVRGTSRNLNGSFNWDNSWQGQVQLAQRAAIPLRVTFRAQDPPSNERLIFSAKGKDIFEMRVAYTVRDREVTQSASSGMKPSGAMKGWSSPYQVCLPSAPTGYTLISESITYSLTGDRACGAWSECNIVKRDDTGVCLEFRLQGHDEDAFPGIRESDGHVNARYRLVVAPATLD
ncbi:MAG: hypothetical protein QOK37_855 [Thermoanaerobaculia bacterium]|jgi:hypothetical protein|nr:hypothetical protein [Thermoanaerobaculia bacterium]